MKVSIITINYNNASGLEKTIKSIINHSNSLFEYIVVDGGSDDGSLNIIHKYKDKINHWVSEPDSGIYNAMNKGIKIANGEYILFVNSGDVLKEEADIKKIFSYLANKDIVYFDMEIADTNNSYIKKYPDCPDFKYFAEDTLPHTASFIRKELFIKHGYYNEEMKIASDWAFFMDAICLHKCSYQHIDDCFSTFYIDGISSLQENRGALLEERNIHIEKTYPLYNSLYKEWLEKKDELYKLKTSFSVKTLKKMGFLKWLRL
ncbi:MAG: glycosyltransferase family 2 protein [Dysgonomonas sp.]|nr:glycosyltransferase family 2 protein [Dysgonomonas sp.]